MNPNDYVRIKPTALGWQEIRDHVDIWNKRYGTNGFQIHVPEADPDGYINGQFWCLMEYFDWSKGCGNDCHFHEMQITPKP